MAILRIKNENGEFIDVPALVGPAGKDGESGVYLGKTESEDLSMRVWVDTSEETNITFNEKLNVTDNLISRYDNVVKFQLICTATEEIAGYENLISNFPKPKENYFFFIKIGEEFATARMYQNNQFTTSKIIPAGTTLYIDGVYFTEKTQGRV